MRRLISLLLGLIMAVSCASASFAHALEPIGCVDAREAGFLGHSADDADQVPADADKGYPHHHGGCAGHHVGVPVAHRDVLPVMGRRALPPTRSSPLLLTTEPGTLHRPPRAA